MGNEKDAAPVDRLVMRLPECPGGRGCTCCGEECDCGCVEACPVFRKWNKAYVPPRGEGRKIADRLRALKRHDVGSYDEGDGYMVDCEDVSSDGRWVEWDDVQKIIDELSA